MGGGVVYGEGSKNRKLILETNRMRYGFFFGGSTLDSLRIVVYGTSGRGDGD